MAEGDKPTGRTDDRPVLPPPPAALTQAEEAAAAREAEREAKAAQKQAERERAREEKQQAKDAKAAQREAQRKADEESARRAAAEKSAADKAAADKAAADRAAAERARASEERPAERTAQQPAVPAGRAKPAPRRTRKAQLRLVQVDAWSVMKTSFLLSIALGIVLVVAVGIILAVLGAAGVWESINSIVQQAVGSEDGPQFDITEYVGTSRVLGFAMIVAVVDVILITAIATLGAFLYNLSAALLGGVEVTLAEDN